MPLTGQIEESLRRQLAAQPAATRRLLVLAAAGPSGNRSLMWRAAGRLGIPLAAAQPAQEAGLVDFGIQVRFRHPLVRSAAYARTVEFHLHKVYTKLGIGSRREPHTALATFSEAGPSL